MSDLEIMVRLDEVRSALQTLVASEPDLLSQLDELFFGEHARYEAGGFFPYLFILPPAATVRTDSQNIAFFPRDKNERAAVLLAPEKHGLVVWVGHTVPS